MARLALGEDHGRWSRVGLHAGPFALHKPELRGYKHHSNHEQPCCSSQPLPLQLPSPVCLTVSLNNARVALNLNDQAPQTLSEGQQGARIGPQALRTG